MAQIVTLEVKAGFKMTCEPAGRAECNIEGELDIPAVEEVIQLLEQIVGRLRKKIEQARERLAPAEQSASHVNEKPGILKRIRKPRML